MDKKEGGRYCGDNRREAIQLPNKKQLQGYSKDRGSDFLKSLRRNR